MNIEWLEDESILGESPYERNKLLRKFAAALQEKPNVWAKYPFRTGNANQYAYLIRTGGIAAFRGGHFEAKSSRGILYVRSVA